MIVPGLGELSLPKYAQALLDLARGGTNAIAAVEIVLTPSAGHTTVKDGLAAPGCLPQWRPTSASAAAASVWLGETGRGYFVLNHDVSGATDRTFRYEVRRP